MRTHQTAQICPIATLFRAHKQGISEQISLKVTDTTGHSQSSTAQIQLSIQNSEGGRYGTGPRRAARTKLIDK